MKEIKAKKVKAKKSALKHEDIHTHEISEKTVEALHHSNPGAPDDDGGKHVNQIVQP